METESLSEILNNKHFLQFASILSVAMAPRFRMRHPEVASVRGRLDSLASRMRPYAGWSKSIRQDFLSAFTALLVDIVEADPKLGYSTEDMDWFVASLFLDEPSRVKVIFSMLFAVSSTRREWLTAEDVAKFTDRSAETWRARAASGEIYATKAGKTWMFPVLALRAYGVDVPGDAIKVEEETAKGE